MSVKMIRMKSGIEGLDEMIEGGYPFPSTILLAGDTGCGKTTFAMQFLAEGAKEGEQCLYFTTFSEPVQWMLTFMQYDFIDKEFFEENIKYVDLGSLLRNVSSIEDILSIIENEITKYLPQRIVIDPITVIKNIVDSLSDRSKYKDLPTANDYRTFLYDLSTMLKNWKIVTILIGESKVGEIYPYEVAYLTDGVLILYNLETESTRQRYLEVLKLRGTNHTTGKQYATMSEKGISLHPEMG